MPLPLNSKKGNALQLHCARFWADRHPFLMSHHHIQIQTDQTKPDQIISLSCREGSGGVVRAREKQMRLRLTLKSYHLPPKHNNTIHYPSSWRFGAYKQTWKSVKWLAHCVWWWWCWCWWEYERRVMMTGMTGWWNYEREGERDLKLSFHFFIPFQSARLFPVSSSHHQEYANLVL